VVEEFDPYSADVEQQLENFDQKYFEQTGQSPFLNFDLFSGSCVRKECKVWAQVVKSTQTMYLYVDGKVEHTWKVSSGTVDRGTPNFDRHPNGRIYDTYSSSKFPGGDYNGLGNMPYAVFIHGGFAIHGTPKSNWPKLGTQASHGCIRLHPDNAKIFNRLVRKNGISEVWITKTKAQYEDEMKSFVSCR
jgi:lipoprotein-anchoring transpeptidase ErfK/SrfK